MIIDTSKGHSKYRSKAKAKKHKLKGNELVQADVHVDGYHGTVDLMSTTMFIDLEVQHPLC